MTIDTTLDDRAADHGGPPPIATDGAPAASAVDARKTYGSGDTAVHALDGVSVEIPSGQVTAIMGTSGSGNSTLMHCIAGLESLASGTPLIVADRTSGEMGKGGTLR